MFLVPAILLLLSCSFFLVFLHLVPRLPLSNLIAKGSSLLMEEHFSIMDLQSQYKGSIGRVLETCFFQNLIFIILTKFFHLDFMDIVGYLYQ